MKLINGIYILPLTIILISLLSIQAAGWNTYNVTKNSLSAMINPSQSYYIDKKYTIIMYADGMINSEDNKPHITPLQYADQAFIDQLLFRFNNYGFTRVRYFRMFNYIQNNRPPSEPYDAVAELYYKTYFEIRNHITPRGVFVLVGHADSKRYAGYTYNYTSIDWTPNILFPEDWAAKTREAGVIHVPVSAHAIGAYYTRRLSWNQLPALTLLLGCETTKEDGEDTWRWAFRFSRRFGDFPDYWIGRALIGFNTPAHVPYSSNTYWYIVILYMFDHILDDNKNIYDAIHEAYREAKRLPQPNISLIVKIDWVDDQGYGYDELTGINGIKDEVEILHMFVYKDLYIDPSADEEKRMIAYNIALNWLKDYLYHHYPQIYQYITLHGYVINIESELKRNHTYPDIVYITFRNLYNAYIISDHINITLSINLTNSKVIGYTFEIEHRDQKFIEQMVGRNLNYIYKDINNWMEAIKSLGVDLNIKIHNNTNRYFWNNTNRGYLLQINTYTKIYNITFGRIIHVHHHNKSILNISDEYLTDPYHAGVMVDYDRGLPRRVYYSNDLPMIYWNVKGIGRELLGKARRIAREWRDDPQLVDNVVKKLVNECSTRKFKYSRMIVYYDKDVHPIYEIMCSTKEYFYYIIFFADTGEYFITRYYEFQYGMLPYSSSTGRMETRHAMNKSSGRENNIDINATNTQIGNEENHGVPETVDTTTTITINETRNTNSRTSNEAIPIYLPIALLAVSVLVIVVFIYKR